MGAKAKINVDGAVGRHGHCGVAAAVCRDSTGLYLGSSLVVYAGIIDPTLLEAFACREALALAEDLRIQMMHVASDCEEVVKDIKQGSGGYHGAIIQEIIARKNDMISCDVHSGKSASDHTTNKGAGLESLDKHQLLHSLVDGASRKGRHKVILPLRSGAMWQTLRFASTNAARRPEFDSGNEQEDDQDRHQEKDVSMEDSVDSAVELGPAKAKPEMNNQEQSSVKQKFWASVPVIGPAIEGVASMSIADWTGLFNFSHKKDEFFSALQHYWLGLRLLWLDVRISSRLLLKLANGKRLSRRERSQLTRTTADIFKLVPFSVFIVVPFMELLLPVFLRLFPNMQPSTFKDRMKEQEALKRKLNARMEYAKFLQDIVKEMAKEVKFTRNGENKQRAEDIEQFIKKVRTGSYVDNGEILGFAKLFSDELTLDNMSRPRLVNMCKYMGIQPYGTNNYLRFMLRRKLKCIKDDDILIQREGVASLSEDELRQACRERGHLGLLPVEEMREELQDWLDLSLHCEVPSSLLILSRAFTFSGKMKPEDVAATLSSLPDNIFGSVGLSLPSEDALSARKRKLEFLKMQDKLIKEEENEEEDMGKLEDKDKACNKFSVKEAGDLARKRMLEKQEELCKVSQALALLSSASSTSKERQEFLSLVHREIELYNSIREGSTTEDANEAYVAAKGSKSARSSVSSALMRKINAMLKELKTEIDDVDTAIGDGRQLLDRSWTGNVTSEEVAAAAAYLKHNLDSSGIEELIGSLSKDKDGKILVEDIVKLGTQAEEAEPDDE
ncbi:mitochondrial proton/calcium exchanger protein-like [Triticum dicoccoides]|uniref:mitochondrial proton/calcium exchanger protein-like n=1 Tax=Triticum dicoccoides TaxID=85692 RepID=UPI00188FBD0B|nr:mitochondrial proton/calcium exchanger protein-like [Triticum dicoccoides]